MSAIYGAVPIALFENASYGQVRVYAALSSFQGTKTSCYPSVKQIADRAHVTSREVHRALNWLDECGWISRVAALGKRNQYDVHRESPQLNNTPVTPDVQVTPDAHVTTDRDVILPLTPTPQTPDVPVSTILKEQEKNIKKNNGRIPYGSHVKLSPDEYGKLTHRLIGSEKTLTYYIDSINDYCASRKKRYTDYAATVRAWARKDGKLKTIDAKASKCPQCGAVIDRPGPQAYCVGCGWMADRDG